LFGAPINIDTGMPIIGDPNLRLWLDASDLGTLWQNTAGTTPAANGSDVALWQDKSGNGKNVSNTDATHLPTYAASIGNFNSRPALQFVGGSSGDMLFRANDLGITGNADRTVVTVWQSTGYTGQNFQHTFHMGSQVGDGTAYGHSAARGGGAGTAIGNHYWYTAFDTAATAVLNTPRVAVSSWDGDGGTSGNGLDSWWVGGAAVGANNRTALATGTNELKIGSRLNGGTVGNEGFTGDLAEVLVFDTVLTAAQRNSLGSYIQNKYGIAVQDAATYRNVVFDDNFTAPNGTVLDGKAPVIGGAVWDQTVGGNVTIQNGSIDTTGGARVILGTFTNPLETDQSLVLTFDATKLSQGGFAGISLLEGNSEKLFVGDTNDSSFWSMATSYAGGAEGTSRFSSSLGSGAGSAVFTYVYNTGLSTLAVNGNTLINGFLPAHAAIDHLQIWNNNGGDIALSSINATFVPEPSACFLAALGLIGLAFVGRRRKQAHSAGKCGS
jgi:hypothetical protein